LIDELILLVVVLVYLARFPGLRKRVHPLNFCISNKV